MTIVMNMVQYFPFHLFTMRPPDDLDERLQPLGLADNTRGWDPEVRSAYALCLRHIVEGHMTAAHTIASTLPQSMHSLMQEQMQVVEALRRLIKQNDPEAAKKCIYDLVVKDLFNHFAGLLSQTFAVSIPSVDEYENGDGKEEENDTKATKENVAAKPEPEIAAAAKKRLQRAKPEEEIPIGILQIHGDGLLTEPPPDIPQDIRAFVIPILESQLFDFDPANEKHQQVTAQTYGLSERGVWKVWRVGNTPPCLDITGFTFALLWLLMEKLTQGVPHGSLPISEIASRTGPPRKALFCESFKALRLALERAKIVLERTRPTAGERASDTASQ